MSYVFVWGRDVTDDRGVTARYRTLRDMMDACRNVQTIYVDNFPSAEYHAFLREFDASVRRVVFRRPAPDRWRVAIEGLGVFIFDHEPTDAEIAALMRCIEGG
jgi:hypothetical protein